MTYEEDVKPLSDSVVKNRQALEYAQQRYQTTVTEYRREYVSNVLDFIRTEYRKGYVVDLDILLCHCQNKLNGNIDSIELDLEHFKEDEICFKKEQ